MKGTLVKRADKLAFYGVPGEGEGTVTYYRMKGFTEISISKNSKEYTRQYVDEAFEETDVTGYSPSVSYAFDMYKEQTPQSDIVKITDDELTGDDAIREIIFVDLTSKDSNGKYLAKKRSFAVIPDSEGGSTDAYTYSGSFKAKGSSEDVAVTISGDALTISE